MKERLAGVWAGALALAGTRRGAALLVAAALVVFAIQSLGWPVGPGRDLAAYLTVYVGFGPGDGVLPWAMLSRTPVAPLVVGGVLDTGSPVLVVAFAALLFAGTVLLYARTALRFGRGTAVLVAVALLLYPGLGVLFHGLAGDAVFAAAFAVWTAIAVECALRPSIARFALLGVATGLLALVRPANQAFLVVGLLPLLLAAPWRVRLGRAVAFGGVTVAILAVWSTVNLVRYDDFTVARGGGSSLPLFRAFTVDHVVGPDNGPASRRLADAVRRNLLGEEPYRSYGIDLATFFREGSPRMHEDLVSLSDRLWGWDSDYDRLGAAAWEGVRAHPGTYVRGVLGDYWKELSKPLFAGRVSSEDTGSTAEPASPPTVVVDGRTLPEPTEGEPIPAEHQSAQLSTPDNSIREVWTSATEHHVVFDDPAVAARLAANDRHLAELYEAFPDHWWSPWLGLQMDRSSKLYPPLWLWLLVGAVAIAWRRPKHWWATLAPVLGGLVMLLATVLAVWAEPAYAVPIAPAFVLFAAVGLLGDRSERRDGTASATSSASSTPFRTSR